MKLFELVRSVSEQYGRRLMHHQAKSSIKGNRITVQQFQYLQAIGRGGVNKVSDLARYFRVQSPTVTTLINRLESQNFVRRKSSSDDARSTPLELTKSGEKILAARDRAFELLASDIASVLDSEELKQYERLTRKVCYGLMELESKEGT